MMSYYDFDRPEEELKKLVKQLFEEFLDVVEESDSGTEFHPTTISTVRCLQIGPLNKLMDRMRELSEAKPAYKIGEYDDK